MKIYPTQQNFGSKQLKVIKPNKKTVDRITIGTSTLLATIILGCGYMVQDRDYFESRYSLDQNKIFKMTTPELDAMVERFNIENLKIKPIENNSFSYNAEIGNFKKVSGTFHKSNSEEGLITGTYKEKGLFKEKNYNFSLKQYPRRDRLQNIHFDLECTPADNSEAKENYSIYQDKDTKQIYVNGREILTQEARDGKNFGIIFFILAVASLCYMASEDITND